MCSFVVVFCLNVCVFHRVVFLLPQRCASDSGFISRARRLIARAESTATTSTTTTTATTTATTATTAATTTTTTATATATTTTTAATTAATITTATTTATTIATATATSPSPLHVVPGSLSLLQMPSSWTVTTYDDKDGVNYEFDFCGRLIRQAVVIQVWQRVVSSHVVN